MDNTGSSIAYLFGSVTEYERKAILIALVGCGILGIAASGMLSKIFSFLVIFIVCTLCSFAIWYSLLPRTSQREFFSRFKKVLARHMKMSGRGLGLAATAISPETTNGSSEFDSSINSTRRQVATGKNINEETEIKQFLF